MSILDETPRGALFRFGIALVHPQMAFIAELKQDSIFAKSGSTPHSYGTTAQECVAAGIDALSWCAAPPNPLDPNETPIAICPTSSLPLLYRGVVLNEQAICQAKRSGFDAVTLRCDLLNEKAITRYLGLCDELEIDALVEARNADEIAQADRAGARVIGLNNRSRENTSSDLAQVHILRKLIPWDVIYVALGDFRSVEDVMIHARLGADAIILSEAFLRTDDKKATLKSFRAAAQVAVDA